MIVARRRRLAVALFLGVVGALPVAIGAQQPGGAPRPFVPLTVERIDQRVYWAKGPSTSNNSNDGFIIGRSGVILFDTKNTLEDERALLAEIGKITSKPIKYVLISHSDGDHINGLAALPRGVTIITHSYAAKTMRDAAARGGPRAPDPAYLPTRTFETRDTLKLDGVRIELYHWAPAHTGGDLVMRLPEDGIVFMGDIVISEIPDPFMHMDNGGSPLGVIASLKGMIALDAKTYVSGHGPTVDKADLQARLARYQAKIDRIRPLVAEGKSLAEVKMALGEPAPQPVQSGRPQFDFTTSIYEELKR